MFWFDAFEHQGTVYLFGKVRVPVLPRSGLPNKG